MSRCTIANNAATLEGGAVDNQGGEFIFSDCTVTSNTASDGGAAYNSCGKMTWNDCLISGNSAASFGGALYQNGGETFWNGCTLSDNGIANGAIVYSEASAITRFDRCAFLGEYDTDTCVLFSEDSASTFLFYHQQQAFPSGGMVCSASEVVVYNANVSVPVSASHEAAIVTCQSSAILDYCEYDCSANDGIGGISCSCTVDDAVLDPELLDDKGAQSCLNSALLKVPQTDFYLVVTKQREPSEVQIAFSNAGDNSLKWNVTRIRANGTAAPWLVAPAAGRLAGCDLGIVTVTLPTWDLTARSDPYALQLELSSNSYRDPIRSLSVTAFISADPVPSSSFVTFTGRMSQLSAGDTVTFAVTPIDGAGMPILDASNQAYFATLTHPVSNSRVSCRVGFETSSGNQEGSCEIPPVVCDVETDDCLPPVGAFVLQVDDSNETVVGGTRYPFNVESCPTDFYDNGDGACVLCLEHVSCTNGSTVSD